MPAGLDQVEVQDLACPSEVSCVAVGIGEGPEGDDYQPVVVVLDDGAWTATKLTLPAGQLHGSLNAVSCTTPEWCVAIGWVDNDETEVSFVAQFDGTSWSTSTLPTPDEGDGDLLDVSCPETGTCYAAAGTYVATLSDGAWHFEQIMDEDDAPGILALDCTSATACLAVGWNDITAELTPDGWSLGTIPDDNREVEPSSVDCLDALRCTVAGGRYFEIEDGWAPAPYVATVSSDNWEQEVLTMPASVSHVFLSHVSCAVAGHCAAVGYGYGANRPMVAIENDGNWSFDFLADAHGSINAVDCPTSTKCYVAGAVLGLVDVGAE